MKLKKILTIFVTFTLSSLTTLLFTKEDQKHVIELTGYHDHKKKECLHCDQRSIKKSESKEVKSHLATQSFSSSSSKLVTHIEDKSEPQNNVISNPKKYYATALRDLEDALRYEKRKDSVDYHIERQMRDLAMLLNFSSEQLVQMKELLRKKRRDEINIDSPYPDLFGDQDFISLLKKVSQAEIDRNQPDQPTRKAQKFEINKNFNESLSQLLTQQQYEDYKQYESQKKKSVHRDIAMIRVTKLGKAVPDITSQQDADIRKKVSSYFDTSTKAHLGSRDFSRIVESVLSVDQFDQYEQYEQQRKKDRQLLPPQF